MATYRSQFTGAQIDERLAAVDDCARVDGAYENLGAGTAEQLASSVVIKDKVPYNFRTSGGSVDIGNRKTEKIIGGSIAWNQLVDTNTSSVTIPSGQKYLLRHNGSDTIAQSAGTAVSVEGGSDNFHNLTRLLGSAIADYLYTLETGTAGAGVAKFRQLFPKPYYAYNAGELMSVKTSKAVMTEFNQWDEEWESGMLDSVTGQNKSESVYIRSTNYIPALPSTSFHVHLGSASYYGTRLYCYDANKNYIGTTDPTFAASPVTLTTLPNTHFVRFYVTGTTYNHDICINLHWDGERDGEYESYKKNEYALDSDLELRGVWKLDSNNDIYCDGDEYESDGKVTRAFSADIPIDLTSLSFTQEDGDSTHWYSTTQPFASYKKPASNNDIANARCDKLCVYAYAYLSSNVGIGITSTGRLGISDVVHTNLANYGTITVICELATPTEETADPYTNPMIVDDFGTEEFVDERDVAVPVGHDTDYMSNLRAKLEMSPNSPDGAGDYIVRQSDGQNSYVALSSTTTIQQIIARLEALEGN